MTAQTSGTEGSATADSSRTDLPLRRVLAALSIVGAGLVLGAVPIFDIYEDFRLQGEPVWLALVENAIPIALAGAIAYVGIWLRRNADVDAEVVARWCLGGLVAAAGIVGWVLFVQSQQSTIKLEYVVVDVTIVGTLAATLVGVYDARRRQQRAVIERQRDRLEFLARVLRHDLLNDMNVVRAEADLLEGHVDGAAAERVESISRSTERMIDLTATARSVMQSITEDGDPSLEPVDLSRVLGDAVDEARDREGVTISVEYDSAELPLVLADDLLGELFSNLASNAAEHAGDAPTVWVDADVGEGAVTVTIADDGPGVPANVRSAAFEQGAKGTSSDGTGVGLFLVSTLADRYGGDVWIDDAADYPGATFRVRLRRG